MKCEEEKGIFDLMDGISKVNPSELVEFADVMTNEVIPEIVKDVEERRLLAAESRHWQLKC